MSYGARAIGILAALLAGASVAGAASLESVADTIGAGVFYDRGYVGERAIIGNVEAGHIWDGHQTLNDGRVEQYVRFEPHTTFTYDSHATRVGGTMVADGFLDGGSPSPTGAGIAWGAPVWSGQIASIFWGGGIFFTTGDSLLYPLMVFGEVGIAPGGEIGGAGARTVDVINSSWGGGNDTGNLRMNVIYDYLADVHGVTAVAAAGNSGQGAGTVLAPANSWNVIAVGATNGAAVGEQVTSFSSGGATGSFNLSATRTKPDIVAPGLNIYMPTMGGSAAFDTSSGTSFAAPVVAGGAALLIDLGKDTGRCTDARLVKAVLLNSAAKLDGWAQQWAYHPVSGTRINYTPLDPGQGTGRVDLRRAHGLYTSDSGGGSGAGAVRVAGWDVNTVADGDSRNYLVDRHVCAGTELTATLVWFMDRSITGFSVTASSPYSLVDFLNDSFDDLDLLVFVADAAGQPTGEPVAASISGWDPADPEALYSGYDNVEHLHFTLPAEGRYVLQVRWSRELFDCIGDANEEEYAVAWSLTSAPGDANFDAEVGITDMAVVANHYGQSGTTWADGDFNGDGAVDVLDLAIVANHFGQVGGAGASPVPEPTTLTLLALGGVALLRRKRRATVSAGTWPARSR